MSNNSLNSTELSKILIFSLLLLPIIFFGFGVLPIIFLIFGIYMMKKTQDFSHIDTAVKNFKIYMQLALFVGVLFTLYFANQYLTTSSDSDYYYRSYRDEFIVSLVLSFVPIIYIILINTLFYKPLSPHKKWVEMNGFFPKLPNIKNKKDERDLDIIKGEKLKSYSVADELIKWAKLKEDGHISEEEYNDARKKLLKRN